MSSADGCPLACELKKTFGYSSFKSDLQRKAVSCVSKGKQNVFVSMPTGAGKSLCYQLPALLFSGVTLVFSPLIALIEDQVTQLKTRKIKAESLNSKTSSADRKRILSDLHFKVPTIKLLYITPELAATGHFRSVLDSLYKLRRISLVAVDEAHCVSEWGHDFRPDYLKLGELRDAYSSVPWLALTATATPRVQKDILHSLRMGADTAVFKAACFRENIFYDVKFKEILKDPLQDLSKFSAKALGLNITGKSSSGRSRPAHNGCGIIYCRTRDGCSMLAGRLSNKGILARAYHAGLPTKERSEIQQQWMEGDVPVIVATISFGMGVDKSNVRFVAHWTMPKSMEAYYQESGRAGRDGSPSFCRIYYSKSDRNELVFLLKQEAQKEKKNGYSAKGQGTVKESTQKTFEFLVQYCEEAKCRHAAIAEYFNDPKPQCGQSCDYCKDPAATRQHARDGSQLACRKATMNASSKYGQPDMSLYGGGRWGHKLDEESESSDDEDGSHGKRRRRDGGSLFDDDFFEAEFRKRRRHGDGAAAAEQEKPGPDCKLREATKTSRVPKLTLKVRNHCLELLCNALQLNASIESGPTLDPQEAAVGVEHSVFISVKSSQTYKLQINNRVKEVESSTREKVLHSSLKKTEKVETDFFLLPSDPGYSGGTSASGFVKASKLFSSEEPQSKRTSCDGNLKVASGSSHIYSSFTPASELLGHTEEELTRHGDPASAGTRDKKGSMEDFSKCVSDLMDDFDYGEEYRLHDVSDSRMIHSSSERSPSFREQSSCSRDRRSRSSSHASAVLEEKSLYPTEKRHASCNKTVVKLDDSLEEQQASAAVAEQSTDTLPPLDTEMEEIGEGHAQALLHEKEGAAASLVPTRKPNNEVIAQQVIASKNSLLGLDLHEASPPPSARLPSTTQQLPRKLMSTSKKKKLVADTVVKHLNGYYKNKRLSSKELFKMFAKRLSEHILSQWVTMKNELDTKIKDVLQTYFSKHKQVTCEKDLITLDSLFEEKDSAPSQ